MKIKKKIILILGVILGLFIIFIIYMHISFIPVSKKEENVTFTIEKGTNKLEIVSNLKSAGLIRSRLSTIIYFVIIPGQNVQAGTYNISKSDSTYEILKQITSGNTKIYKDTVSVTFVEGLRFYEYADIIAQSFNTTSEEVISIASNKEFLNKLINKYWFITDEILDEDIYYPLEGYIHPNTYEFYIDSSIENVLIKMIDETDKILSKYKDEIEKSEYSVHEILTIASIVEKEALTSSDRKNVASVLYNRLEINMALGCDVTTYYGAKMDLDSDVYPDFNVLNAYNTRNANFAGLPASSICSPSESSIIAAISPSNTDYLYFVADKNGKCYFYKTGAEFNANKYNDMAVGG